MPNDTLVPPRFPLLSTQTIVGLEGDIGAILTETFL